MNRLKSLFTILIGFFLFSCGLNEQAVIETFLERAGNLQQQYAPDLSLNVFEADLLFKGEQWLLKGATTVPELKPLIIALVDSVLGQNKYQEQFDLLPDSTVADSTFAIIRVSVANLRRKPAHRAELVDQQIMGKVVDLLQKKRGWYRLQTGYGYIGWINSSSLYRTNSDGIQQWKQSKLVRVTDLDGWAYSQPDNNSTPVTDIVLNAVLQEVKNAGDWKLVKTPDGRSGYIRSSAVVQFTRANELPIVRSESIIHLAKSMMGVPYLWGGNSSKTSDCSGFTQTVFGANGIQLPRDARQQFFVGEEIVPDSSFSNVLPGDLFFFGSEDRITHVGISLGGAEFIHQSGDVHVNSLDPEAHNFNAYRYNTFKKIKRIIEAQ